MIDNFTEWLFFTPNIISILIIGVISEALKNLILGGKTERNTKKYIGWKHVYFTTYKAQALGLGIIFGLFPGIMVPEVFQGEGIMGAVLNYAGCGATAMIFYSTIVSNFKSYIENSKREF
ncbi:MAG: hypothetical protein ACW98D_16865 [Promethearchaeota archaeon]|jgi:hypothetical protein